MPVVRNWKQLRPTVSRDQLPQRQLAMFEDIFKNVQTSEEMTIDYDRMAYKFLGGRDPGP